MVKKSDRSFDRCSVVFLCSGCSSAVCSLDSLFHYQTFTLGRNQRFLTSPAGAEAAVSRDIIIKTVVSTEVKSVSGGCAYVGVCRCVYIYAHIKALTSHQWCWRTADQKIIPISQKIFPSNVDFLTTPPQHLH